MTAEVDTREQARQLAPMLSAVASTTVGQLPVFLTASLAPQIGRDLALPASGFGFGVAAFFASSTLASVTLGRLADKVGGRTMMRLGVFPVLLASLGIGLVVDHWGELVAALAVAGLSNGTIQPAANRYLSKTVGDGRQGFAFGVKQAAIPSATLLGGLAVPGLGATVGWRWAFIGLAVLACCVGALIPWRRSPTATHAAPGHLDERPFARSALIVLAFGIGAGSAAVNALGSFFVLSAVHIGVSDSAAGLTAAAGSVTSIAMRLIVGHVADRRSYGHLRIVAAMAAFGAIGVLLLALGVGQILLIAAVIGYGFGWGWAGLFNYAVVRTHPGAPGRASGIIMAGGSGGACFGPLAFGVIADHVGFSFGWIVAAALLVVAAVVILAGRRALYSAGVVR